MKHKLTGNMRVPLILVLASVTIFGIGCSMLVQDNIDERDPSGPDSKTGLIVGSVTAPFAQHYHENVLFYYRALDDDEFPHGVLTSGTSHKYLTPYISSCDEDGLGGQCGRLFAVRLPAGRYEIHRVRIGDIFQDLLPAVFSVAPGQADYIGNLHADFCIGQPRELRGAILGADVSVVDDYARDTGLLREKFSALRTITIRKRLLPGASWRVRVSYEPYDWGDCGAGPAASKAVAD